MSGFSGRLPGWRLWLAGGLAVVLLAVLVIARLRGDGDDGDSNQAVPTPSSPLPSVPTVTTQPDDGVVGTHASPREVTPDPRAVLVAKEFLTAWANHPDGVDRETWFHRIQPYVELEFGKRLKLADPATLPDVQITGEPKSITASVSNAQLAFPSTIGELVVGCVLINNTWLVSEFDVRKPPS